MTVAVLGLGGNIGDPRSLMASAIERLSRHPGKEVNAVSALYHTPPWGKTDQPAFLNAAVRISTHLSPHALLKAVLELEQTLGRRRAERWGPRTIDIDILVYGSEALDDADLQVPHPRLKERSFALAPLVDVMPEADIERRPAKDWLGETDRAGMQRVAEPGWEQAP